MGCSVSQSLKGTSRSRSVIWTLDRGNGIESKLNNLLFSIRWACLMNMATHLSPNTVGLSSGCNFRKSESNSEQLNSRQDKVGFPLKPLLLLDGKLPRTCCVRALWTGIYLYIAPRGRAKHFTVDTCFSAMSASYLWTQFAISISALQIL